jgi:hypothetical protein
MVSSREERPLPCTLGQAHDSIRRLRRRIGELEQALHCGTRLACGTTDPGRCFCTCDKCLVARASETAEP